MTEQTSSSHARIEAALARLGADASPPAGWQERVLEALKEPKPARRRWIFALPLFAAAAAAGIALVLWPGSGGGWSSVQLAVSSQPIAQIRDGSAQRDGSNQRTSEFRHVVYKDDLVALTATTAAPHRALWLYRGDRKLVIACPGAAKCMDWGYTLVATIEGLSIGYYMAIAVASDTAIPQPAESLDEALSAAKDSHAVVTSWEIEVH